MLDFTVTAIHEYTTKYNSKTYSNVTKSTCATMKL